jgi:hypothetical protein
MLERHEIPACGEPGPAARVVEEDEGEEAFDLRLAGHQLAQQAGEADGFLAQVGAQILSGRGGVAFVEDQVDYREDGIEAGGKALGAGIS